MAVRGRASAGELGSEEEVKRALAILALVIFSGLILVPAALANHKYPDCHGKNSVPCRPDPQPSHGKDCLKHGKGGVNEDHCKGSVPSPTPTPTVTPTPSPSGTPTPNPSPSTPAPSSAPTPRSHPQGLAMTGVDASEIVLIASLGIVLILFGLAVRGPRH